MQLGSQINSLSSGTRTSSCSQQIQHFQGAEEMSYAWNEYIHCRKRSDMPLSMSFAAPTLQTEPRTVNRTKIALFTFTWAGSVFGSSRRFFSLRNYKLHVDQIQSLELEAEPYTRTMASALAVLHWHTRIDALDIEFVLGSTPLDRNCIRRALPLHDIKQLKPGSSTFEHTTNISPNFRKRSVCLWLLDFDACSSITMNSAGVEKAVKAFF